MKKLLSLVMAAAMMATICMSALAADPAPDFSAGGAVSIPEINVTVCGVPEGGAALFVNPYGFSLKLADASILAVGEEEGDDDEYVSDKVFSPIYWIQNNTTMDLDVYVNGTATVKTGSTMGLAKAAIGPDSTKKEALIYCAFGSATIDGGAATAFQPTTAAFNAENPGSNFLLGAALAKEAQRVATLEASAEVGEESTVAFRFAGDAVSEPKDPWDTAKDAVDVKLYFTYKPAAPTT